jgi:hypothetical protein
MLLTALLALLCNHFNELAIAQWLATNLWLSVAL